jgi:anti-sigma factor RsiW
VETVNQDNSTNEELTRYLLGEMPEEEQTDFEMRYFSDGQLFGELCARRNQLIDSYVSGRLSPPMRERFEAGIDKSWGHQRTHSLR